MPVTQRNPEKRRAVDRSIAEAEQETIDLESFYGELEAAQLSRRPD